MKKIIFAIFFFILTISVAQAFDSYYVYKGESSTHRYQIKFPSTWKAFTFGESKQGFSQSYNQIAFEIYEFDGQSLSQVINYYTDENIEFISSSDFVFHSDSSDYIAKKLDFHRLDPDEYFSKITIKMGQLWIVMTYPKDDSTLNQILNSFAFTDSWRHYINTDFNYYFSFPDKYALLEDENTVQIKDISNSQVFFELKAFKDSSIMDAQDYILSKNDKISFKEDISLSDNENAIALTLSNMLTGKKRKYILFGKEQNSYALSAENLETNYPHKDYYDYIITEIIESFDTINIDEDYSPYLNFIDIKNNHPNSKAINYLSTMGIVQGYDDGTFGPDDTINRAELTKMVVESVTDLESGKYNNCFTDVNDEWFAKYICFAKENKWVEGYEEGDFRPKQDVNRAEAMKIILEVLMANQDIPLETAKQKYTDIDSDKWYYKYFAYLSNRGVIDLSHVADNQFFINKGMTRKEVAEIIYGLEVD